MMKKAVLLTLWVCSFLIGQAWGQTTQTYAYQNNAFVWDAPTGSATVVAWDNTSSCDRANDDTKRTVTFPGGFTFTFGGTSYNQVRILTNGMLQFSAVNDGFHTDYTPQALPAPASSNPQGGGCPNVAPLNVLMPYWIDITTTPLSGITNANVRYQVLGSAPNRRFVVTWDNVALFGNPATRYSFQAVLYEGASSICNAAAPSAPQCANGEFEYRYTTGASSGTGATVGVQLSSSDYTQYAFNQSFIDTVNGTNLRWYPAPPAAQQPLAAEYRFDDAVWAGTQGEVRDTSGNGFHGIGLGTAAISTSQFKTCVAAIFPNNTSNATINAAALGDPVAATGYAPGTTGAATFWYRPSANGADAMLFDSSAVANRPFFIMRTAANGIRFVLSDSVGALVTANSAAVTAANTWVHVAVSWKIAAGTNATILQVFINGTLRVVQRGTTNGLLPTLARPAFVGDNRTSGVTPSSGTGNSANGYMDEVRLYNSEISGVQARSDFLATRSVCTVLSHFDISINGTTGTSATNVAGRTCDQVEVTFTARDVNNIAVVIAANAVLSVSTGHGTWTPVSGASSFTDTGSGGATFTFNNSATATFLFNNTFSETSSLNINSGGIVERAAADPSLVTSAAGCAAGFNGCEQKTPQCTPTASPALGYAALFTKMAGTEFNLEGVALKSTGLLETGFSGDVTVDLLANSNTGVALGTDNCPTSQTATVSLGKVSFSAGRATFSAINVATPYRDVRMRFTCTAAVCGNAITVCSTDNFAIRPGFVTLTSSANATAPGPTATPIVKAGSSFNLSAAGTTGYGGTITLDTTKLTAQTTTQAATVANGGTVGTLSPATLTVNAAPAPTANASYGEVGYLYLAAGAFRDQTFTAVDQPAGCAATSTCDCVTDSTDDNYLSTSVVSGTGRYGCYVGSSASNMGRFVPDHFDTVLSSACGTFSYSGQLLPLSVTARNLAGGTTANYQGAFAKTAVFSNSDAGGAAGTFSPASLVSADFSSGVANLLTLPTVKFTFTSKTTAPSTLQLRVTDADAVSSSSGSPVVEGTSSIRSGRLWLGNAYGSDQIALTVPVEVQYWTGSAFVKNTLDSCTALAASNIALGNKLGGLSAYAGPVTVSAIAGGAGTIGLPKPAAATAGSVDVMATLGSVGTPSNCNTLTSATSAALGYLSGKWCGAAYDRDPVARATFGIAGSGNKKGPVYIRESY